jgi:hypothetical protein
MRCGTPAGTTITAWAGTAVGRAAISAVSSPFVTTTRRSLSRLSGVPGSSGPLKVWKILAKLRCSPMACREIRESNPVEVPTRQCRRRGLRSARAPSLSRPLRRVRPLQGLDADASSAYTGFPAGSPPVPRHPSARLAHSRPDGLEPGQHRRQIRGVVVPEPGMRGGLLQSAGEFDVLVMPGRHDQPRAPGRPAHVPGAHRGRRVCRQEMKHRGQDNGYRLGHIDHGAHPAYREPRA